MTPQQLHDRLQDYLNTIVKNKGYDEHTALAYQLGYIQALLVREMYRDSHCATRVLDQMKSTIAKDD